MINCTCPHLFPGNVALGWMMGCVCGAMAAEKASKIKLIPITKEPEAKFILGCGPTCKVDHFWQERDQGKCLLCNKYAGEHSTRPDVNGIQHSHCIDKTFSINDPRHFTRASFRLIKEDK